MTCLTNRDIDRLAPDFVVANSPGYIYRRFSADGAVRALSLRNEETLVEALKAADQSQRSNDKVDGLAVAVALLIGDKAQALHKYLDERQQGYIPWLAELSLYATNARGTPTKSIQMGPSALSIDLRRLASVSPSTSATTKRASVDLVSPSSSSNSSIVIPFGDRNG